MVNDRVEISDEEYFKLKELQEKYVEEKAEWQKKMDAVSLRLQKKEMEFKRKQSVKKQAASEQKRTVDAAYDAARNAGLARHARI
jgi:predicted patatin/cPLA2 family phospholipase